MKVILTGATGTIGSALTRALVRRGDTVAALTRDVEGARQVLGPEVETLGWDAKSAGPWRRAFEGADAVVNLAGEPIEARRWSRPQKERMWNSRINATRAVADAIAALDTPPRVLVNGSAMGYYGSRGATVLTEDSPPAGDFLARLVQAWEGAARPVEASGTRLALARSGVVLSRSGGALPLFVLPFRFHAGGVPGHPDAWLSWIHLDDEVGGILHVLDNEQIRGPFNLTAPRPVTFGTFSRQIAEVLQRPAWVPLMSTGIKLGLGEMGESVMASLRVLPQVLERSGYTFRYPDSREALRSLLADSHMALPNALDLLTTWRTRGMLEALSSLAFRPEK